MQRICARFGDDIDGCPARASQFRRIAAPIYLKLLHSFLAHGQAHSSGVFIRLPAVDRNAVPSSVAAVDGDSALRSLLYPKICAARDNIRVRNTRKQQSKGKIIAPVDRQVANLLWSDVSGL